MQDKDEVIETLVFHIDEHPIQRKKGQLINLLTHLQSKNSIFQKMEYNLALCLLKIGKYHANFPG